LTVLLKMKHPVYVLIQNCLMYKSFPYRDDNLYLSIDLHRQVALLIVELTMKYVPDIPIQTASLLTESMKQVSC